MTYDETESLFADDTIDPETPGSFGGGTDPEDEGGPAETDDGSHSPIASPGSGVESDPEGAGSAGAARCWPVFP